MSHYALAILDDYSNIALNHFQQIPNLSIFSFSTTLDPTDTADLETLIERLQPYHVISTMRERTPFPQTLLRNLPNLQLLLTTGLRNASLDLPSFKERDIPVAGTKSDAPAAPEAQAFEPPWAPNYSAVNQHAWALLLSLCGRIPQDDRALKTDMEAWQSGLGTFLAGRTLGIVGLGRLGQAMAKVAVQSFGMQVLTWSENMTLEKADEAALNAGLGKGVFKVVSKEALFQQADVVSLHLVLSDRTRGIVGARELSWMKKGCILLNTSRGGLIDEQALIRTLKSGGIGGFAADVFWKEPLPNDSVWRKVDEWSRVPTVLSPHMGYVNSGTMNRWYQEQAENLSRWLQGQELLNRFI